jgi:hypothetical protein
MPTDDEAARKARADRLHAQIEASKEKDATRGIPEELPVPASTSEQTPPVSPPPESPRDFVHRRMREVRQKKADS